MFTGYAGWTAGIKDWIDADDFSDAQVQTFLALAQVRLNRELSTYNMEKVEEITVPTTGVPVVLTAQITDFSKIRLVSWPGVGPLDVKSINEIQKLIKSDPQTGDPKCYCIDAGKIYFYPTPPEETDTEVFYYEKVPLLSGSVDSNTFTEHHPDSLLYASCLEAASYMTEDERIPIWNEKYLDTLEGYNNISKRIKLGSTPLVREFTTERRS